MPLANAGRELSDAEGALRGRTLLELACSQLLQLKRQLRHPSAWLASMAVPCPLRGPAAADPLDASSGLSMARRQEPGPVKGLSS
eukprot:1882564-Prymnesium_polylepis.1